MSHVGIGIPKQTLISLTTPYRAPSAGLRNWSCGTKFSRPLGRFDK